MKNTVKCIILQKAKIQSPNFATDFLNLSFLGVVGIYFCDILKTIKAIDTKFSLGIHVPFISISKKVVVRIKSVALMEFNKYAPN